MKNLCLDVGKEVGKVWGTHVLVENSDLTAAMVNVKAPTNDFNLAS